MAGLLAAIDRQDTTVIASELLFTELLPRPVREGRHDLVERYVAGRVVLRRRALSARARMHLAASMARCRPRFIAGRASLGSDRRYRNAEHQAPVTEPMLHRASLGSNARTMAPQGFERIGDGKVKLVVAQPVDVCDRPCVIEGVP